MKIAIHSHSRADEGIYMPLITELEAQNIRYAVSGNHLSSSTEAPFIIRDFDWMVVLGDTFPMLEAAIEAIKNGIPVAHIHGGDLTGSVDDSIRHAITKLAHLHFPSLPEHRERLLKMGEDSWRITVVGPLGIYEMRLSQMNIREMLDLDKRPIIIVLQHPIAYEGNKAPEQITETLEAVNNPDWQPVVIYPNGENGSKGMIQVIKQYQYKAFKNLPYMQFQVLLKEAACIVGNSSCGLVEAPIYNLPCVDIGDRQNGRLDGHNAVYAKYDRHDIRTKIEFLLQEKPKINNPYRGEFGGSKKIVEVLLNTPINQRLLEKRNAY